MNEELISQVALFSSLPQDEIQRLAQILRLVEFPAGVVLFHEGDLGDLFFILLAGEVEVIKALETPDERLLGVRYAGSFIGEMSLFNPEGRRTASIRALTPIQLLEMSRSEIDALLHRRPMLAYNMVSVLSTRLAESENLTIRDLHRKNQELTLAYQELKAAQGQLIEKEKLEGELQAARRIQFSMMPRQLPQRPDYSFEACFQPMRAVGGDFYDFVSLGKDRLGVTVGDVSDHGVPAALFMAMTVTLLRAEARRSSSPAEVLRRVNRQLLETNQASLFVTILYGILHYSTGEFDYVRAGHERPLVCDRRGGVRELGQGAGMALGLVSDLVLEEGQYSLLPGQTLLLYTDGVIDDVDSRDEAFGRQRLHDALRELCCSGEGEICPALLERVQVHRGPSLQFDDITLLLIRSQERTS